MLSGASVELSHDDESNLPVYSLLVFTFILLLAPQQIFPALAPLRIAMMSIAATVILTIGTRLGNGRAVVPLDKGVICGLLLAAWAVFTIPLSLWPGGSVEFMLGKYLKTIVVFLLLISLINSFNRLKLICMALLTMCIPLAATAIYNLFSGVTMQGSLRIVGYDAPLSENPNDMALLLNLFIPLAIALFLASKSVPRKWMMAAVIVIMSAAVLATYSRAGFLTLGLVYVCYLVRLRSRPERYIVPVLIVMVLLMLPLLPGDLVGRLSTITDISSDQTGSAQTRLRDSVAALGLVFENPVLGVGVGMNALAMNDARGDTWTEIHNAYLTFAVELGLPGLFLFLLLFWAAVAATQKMMYLTRGNPPCYELYCLAEGLQISLIAFALAACFHPVAYHFYFYYIAGLAIALGSVGRALSPLALTNKQPSQDLHR